MIFACVNGSSITAITLLLSPYPMRWKIIPFVKEPPTQATAAIPIASPFNPNIAVIAIELSGDVQIIFMIPPSKNPMTSGDWSAAAAIVPPIFTSVALTAGSTTIVMILANGAIIKAPAITSNPSGSFLSITGAINPTKYPAMKPCKIQYPPTATPATTASTGFTPIASGTEIAAATPPRLPLVAPRVWKNSRFNKSPVMYLCTASIKKVAIAAFAIPDIASEPFGAFVLNSEKPASAKSNNPTPEIIVNIK